jgi:type IV pilus assembly protein PilY1
MNTRLLKKWLASLLIVITANPLAITAAYGRDSDIFLSTTTGVSTAEPNILIILDTSDSMNIPEAWREYPPLPSTAVSDEVNYDSHVEYLWNDCTLVRCSGGEQTTPATNIITTAASSPTVLTPAGSWAGATLAERQALWNAAKTYANGTEAGDPGPRTTYRNYNDPSWIYWLPQSAPLTDARLRSPMFNRFRGGIGTINGTRGGIAFSGTTDYRGNNKCRDSGTDPAVGLGHSISGVAIVGTGVSTKADPSRTDVPQGLTPSTIYAPSAAPRNSGRYLDTYWRRWDPFDNTRYGRVSGGDTTYPLPAAVAGNPIDWSNATPVPSAPGADCSIASNCWTISSGPSFGNNAARVRAQNEFLTGGAGGWGSAARDSWPAVPNYGDNIWYLGYRGQPIRVQVDKGARNVVDDSEDSKSRWTRLNADLGGFNFAELVNGYNLTVLTNVLSVYDAYLTIPAGGDPRGRAWRGNRDAANLGDWHYTVGTPAYVDSQVTEGRINGGSLNTVNINTPSQGANGFAVGHWINVPNAGTAGANLITQITAITATTMTISPSAAQATGGDRLITRNFRMLSPATASVARCTVSYTLDADPGAAGNQAAFNATSNNDGSNTQRKFIKGSTAAACKAGAATLAAPGNDCTGVVPTDKAPGGAGDYITARYSGCSWSGRSSLYVEGVGTYYYGGNCGAASSCRGTGYIVSGASCAAAGTTTTNYGSSSYVTNNNCVVSGLSNITVGATAMAGAALNNGANGSTYGCNNKSDVTAACLPRENGNAAWGSGSPVGVGCTYFSGTPSCPTDTWYTAATTNVNDYQAYHNINRVNEMVHDCTADDGTVGNPGTSTTGSITSGSSTVTVASTAGFTVGLTVTIVGAGPGGANKTANITSVLGGPPRLVLSSSAGTTVAGASVYAGGSITNTQDKPFGNGWAATVSNAANNAAPYSTDNANTFGNGSGSTRADMYSVNYLNFKFGPKGPNGYPIGRKTRLQIAKDALTGLVASTDGVRFGLMVFNRTAGCTTTVGTIDTAVNNTLMNIPDNPGFVIGQAISITGAGPAGATLNTTVAGIAVNNATDPPTVDITLAAAASTSVSGANVQANPCSGAVSNEGANVASRLLRMGSNSTDLPDYNNRTTLNTAINAAVAAARTPLTESLYEAYLYYAGRTPRFGTSSASAIIGGTVTQGRDTQAVCASGGTQDCPLAGRYRSPMLNNPNTVSAPAGCQKNFIIMITDGGPEDDWSANSDIKRLQYAGALGTVAARTTIDANAPNTATDQFEAAASTPYGPTDIGGTSYDSGYIWLDELAYFMSLADVSPGALNLPGDTGPDRIPGRQSVVTYTVGFAGGNSPVLSNAAQRAGATYFLANQSAELQDALTAALTAIRDWNPTAGSPTVPISALNRAENAAEVYFGFFQPDPSQAWKGTLKKFGLSIDPADCGAGVNLCVIGQTILTKAAPNPSPVKNIQTIDVDPITNTQQLIVDPLAVSYWGPTTLTDGNHPDNGGTGYQLLHQNVFGTGTAYTPATRLMYTLVSGAASTTDLTSGSNRVSETNAAITKTMLGNPGMSDANRATLINFILGGDQADAACSDNSSGTPCVTWRAWPHFDVQHSRSAVVAYDITTTPPTESIYYMSNDGVVHAVDTNTGKELWSFLVEEAFGKIATLMADNAGPQVDAGDGSMSLYIEDTNGDGIIQPGEKAWLYFGLRRGGRSIYALDVTNRLAPQFKWKATAESGSGQLCTGTTCTANAAFNELGQTWSSPEAGKIRSPGGAGTVALFFAGGYDTQEDGVPPAASANTMGRAVYIVDADTGAVINWFGAGGPGVMISGAMTYSIPSDLHVVNSDFDSQNFLDRIYVGDMGGNVWRFDINDPSPAAWRGKQLADLSDASGQRRKIFFPPVLVKQINPERYDAVYVGTGDREHPRLTGSTTPPTVADKIFMIMDRDVNLTMSGAAAASYAGGDFIQLTNTTLTGIDLTQLATRKGWYRDLDDGEKVVNAPTVFFQKLQFGTYAPTSQINACTPPGEGRLNEIDALTGGLFNLNTADGLNAQDRYYIARSDRSYHSSGKVVCLGTSCFLTAFGGSGLGPNASALPGRGSATKIYWYMEPEQ